MPSRKQPPTLFVLCTRRASNIAEYACITIEENYGDYGNSNTRREINVIRNHFLQNIGHSFENVCTEINRSRLTFRFPTDPRILVDFMFHEHKKIIGLPVLGQMQEFAMHLTSTFWAEKLGAMKRITNIDISEIDCSDEIIKAISDNCIHLAHLNITASADALTDEGLLLLKKCPDLLIILDYKQFSEVSKNTIKLLVEGLPNLIGINYLHMGAVLSSGFENMILLLRSVEEEIAEAEHVKAIAKLCPHLKRLALGKNMTCTDEILNSLTVSNLKVDTLDLSYFTSAHITPFLKEKGTYLRTLKIIYPRTYNTNEDIITIGLNCPFLKHLSWVTNGSKIGHTSVNYRYTMSKHEEQQIFSNLNTLKLCINASDFDLGIPQLCLQNASNIKDILFIVNDPTDTNADLYEILTEILRRNNMTHLNRLRITGLYFLSSSTKAVELIFNRLTSLKQCVYISKMNAEVVDYFKYMESEILENNLNLRLIWSNLTDFQNILPDVEGDDEDEDVDENELFEEDFGEEWM